MIFPKSALYFSFLLLLELCCQGQNPNFTWVKQLGGLSSNMNSIYSFSTALDKSGNIYTTGLFDQTIDFDPGPGVFNLTATSISDAFILKLDNSGNFLWARQFQASSSGGVACGLTICVDSSGNILSGGYFLNSIDLDPGLNNNIAISHGFYDFYVSKLDSNGNFLWGHNFGGGDNDQINSLSIDKFGNVICTGYHFNDTIDFDPGPGIYNVAANGGRKVYILKLNQNGNLIWVESLDGEDGKSVFTDTMSNIYLTGSFDGTIDFDFGVGIFNLTSAWQDVFILKLDQNGNFLWAKNMGGFDADQGNSIKVDGVGNVYSIGTFRYQADFDPGPGTFFLNPIIATGQENTFISKLNANGDFIWAKALRTNGCNAYGQSIVVDNLNNVYTSGRFCDSMDINPGPQVNMIYSSHWGAFLNKLDSNGNFLWGGCLSGSGYIYCQDLFLDPTGVMYSTGYFEQTVDFNPNIGVDTLISQTSQMSGYILRMNQCMNTMAIIQDSSCNSYTWNSQTYTLTGIYSHTLINSLGCDSVISLNLTIDSINTSVNQVGNILTAGSASGTSYQWVTCPSFTPISGATNQVYMASNNGDYAVVLHNNLCTDTSSCFTVSGLELHNNDINRNLSIIPNPTSGKITISNQETLKHSLILIKDLQGNVDLVFKVIDEAPGFLDLSVLATGVYCVEIIQQFHTYRLLLIKE